MIESLSPRIRRGLAVSILIALIATIYFAVIQPLADNYLARQQTIAQLQDAISKYRRAAAELPARQRILAALSQNQTAAAGFLEGPSDTLIAAQIQNRIKALADAAKLDLRSSQVLPSAEEGKSKRIAVREQMSGTLAGILMVFHGLESAVSPSLFLDNVSMRARPLPVRANASPTEEVIEVQFDVYGYAHSSG